MLTTLSLAAGACTVAGLIAVVLAFRQPLPHLAGTLEALDQSRTATATATTGEVDVSPDGSQLERLGGRLMRLLRLRPSRRVDAALRLRGITAARMYGEQAAMAVMVPLVLLCVNLAITALVPLDWTITTGVVLLGGVVGWFLPRLRMSAGAAAINADANEALLVYIDLVVLERLADRHIHDALANAADCSDNPLFRQIRIAINRADLAREHPWTELANLAEELQLPALGDIADIARLQLQGVSLTAALRARAAELRNAHVAAQQQEADKITARMDVYKTLPVLMVAALFALPPMFQIAF